jgi:hypothetical protein
MAPLRQADSIERTAQICPRVIPTRSGISLALSHQRVAVKRWGRRGSSRPSAGGAGRARARALTGLGWSGSASPGAEGAATSSQDQFRRHIALSCCAQSRTRILAMCGYARKIAISLCTVTRPTAAHLVLLSCYQAVGGLRLAGPAPSFAKLRSGKSQAKHPGSRLRADSLLSLCRPLGRSPRVMFGN